MAANDLSMGTKVLVATSRDLSPTYVDKAVEEQCSTLMDPSHTLMSRAREPNTKVVPPRTQASTQGLWLDFKGLGLGLY